ncbi:MAG: dipeptidase [Bacteroidetes bacterium]|jgi:acetylornithine deacetylase/succinyl-diaminopimelate desuccinylase-like protein|nr:dipeptidase [Bacteroidota bacterium]
MPQKLPDYIAANKHRFVEELKEFLRIPSVSANPDFEDDVFDAAEFVKGKLLEAGADVAEICPTAGYPIVYGEKMVDPALPTVLVYGHYDVQPADPYDLWESPPFEPTERNGSLYARGACDDKGQVYMHIKAFEYMVREKALPCNVKFMIEGEEEVGSANLGNYITENKARLKADVILISDTSMLGIDTPSITVGLRGLAYLEVEVTGPNRDLHSGVYGGAVANPANVLAQMIASLHNSDGSIAIPGFYEEVLAVSPIEKEAMARIPFNEPEYKAHLDIAQVGGETGYTVYEKTSVRPTLDVNGMWSGYTGEGAKTVLPSKAFAKISMRLVPNQHPDTISELFTKHFKSLAPASVKVKVTPHHGGEPVVVPVDLVEYQAASRAYEATFGKVPIPVRSGGSIPIVALFEKVLGLKSIMMGFGLDSDAIHSPNEKFDLANFYKGIETLPMFYHFYTQAKSGK